MDLLKFKEVGLIYLDRYTVLFIFINPKTSILLCRYGALELFLLGGGWTSWVWFGCLASRTGCLSCCSHSLVNKTLRLLRCLWPHTNLQGRSGKHKRSHSLEELLWCWRPLRQGQLWHHSLQVELAKLIKAADSGIGSSFLLSLPHLFREISIRRSLNNLPVSSPSLDWGTAQTPIQVSLGL